MDSSGNLLEENFGSGVSDYKDLAQHLGVSVSVRIAIDLPPFGTPHPIDKFVGSNDFDLKYLEKRIALLTQHNISQMPSTVVFGDPSVPIGTIFIYVGKTDDEANKSFGTSYSVWWKIPPKNTTYNGPRFVSNTNTPMETTYKGFRTTFGWNLAGKGNLGLGDFLGGLTQTQQKAAQFYRDVGYLWMIRVNQYFSKGGNKKRRNTKRKKSNKNKTSKK